MKSQQKQVMIHCSNESTLLLIPNRSPSVAGPPAPQRLKRKRIFEHEKQQLLLLVSVCISCKVCIYSCVVIIIAACIFCKKDAWYNLLEEIKNDNHSLYFTYMEKHTGVYVVFMLHFYIML